MNLFFETVKMHEEINPSRRDWLRFAIALAAGFALLAVVAKAEAQNHDKNLLQSVVLEPTPAAQPLNIESESVEIETVVTTIEKTHVKFGAFDLPGSVREIGSTTKTKKATLIIASEPPRAAYAYTPGFESVELIQVDDTTFLLEAKAGRYLLVFDLSNGSQIRPVIVESSGPDTSELTKLAVDLASKMDDQDTTARVAAALKGAVYNLTQSDLTQSDLTQSDLTQSDLTLSEGYEIVQAAITSALLGRPRGPSRDKPWIDGFRRPLDEAILAAGVETIEDFAAAIQGIANALAESQSSSHNASVSSNELSVRGSVEKTIIPLSATFPPAWIPPSQPHVIGQIHNGRRLTRVCTRVLTEHGPIDQCTLVWRAIR